MDMVSIAPGMEATVWAHPIRPCSPSVPPGHQPPSDGSLYINTLVTLVAICRSLLPLHGGELHWLRQALQEQHLMAMLFAHVVQDEAGDDGRHKVLLMHRELICQVSLYCLQAPKGPLNDKVAMAIES